MEWKTIAEDSAKKAKTAKKARDTFSVCNDSTVLVRVKMEATNRRISDYLVSCILYLVWPKYDSYE